MPLMNVKNKAKKEAFLIEYANKYGGAAAGFSSKRSQQNSFISYKSNINLPRGKNGGNVAYQNLDPSQLLQD